MPDEGTYHLFEPIREMLEGWNLFSNDSRVDFVLIVLFAFIILNASTAVTNTSINNSSMIIPSIDNRSINNNTTNISSIVNMSSINLSKKNNSGHAVPVIDLSGYGKNRLNKSLAGYKNIVYPMAGSSGFTATTSGGGGGCGC